MMRRTHELAEGTGLPPTTDADEKVHKKPSVQRRRQIFLVLLLVGLFIAFFVGIAALLYILPSLLSQRKPVREQMSLVRLWWTREETLEVLEMALGEGWVLPEGSDLLGKEMRNKGYEQVLEKTIPQCKKEVSTVIKEVPDHVEKFCFADGKCEEHTIYRKEEQLVFTDVCNEEVPIYKPRPLIVPWYRYSTPIWHFHSVVTANGEHTETPHWPISLPNGAVPEASDGRQRRVRNRKARYFAEFSAPSLLLGTLKTEIDEERFAKLGPRVGQRVPVIREGNSAVTFPED
ncbi:hypothetical protein PAPYR_10427 [Paratrimastix pyriformis]|uniref:Uncharacterized protein n=1 Tax=Paratrimastix pyriformis TaxID=342808 RepID=A0ABQ8U616_9EUKA|nr:hypothetical protein PAPYR_10427 [Paratrimastix pyriformis]